jgi:hypothetical protein
LAPAWASVAAMTPAKHPATANNLRNEDIRGGLVSRPSLNYLMIPMRFIMR